MTDTPTVDLPDTEIENKPGEEAAPGNHTKDHEEEPQTTPGKFREASYVVLFIAAVFVINAMETGSYRTPWPVAIVTLLAGLGLFGYSWYLQSRSKI